MTEGETKKDWVPTYHVVCQDCEGEDPEGSFISGGRGSLADGEPEKKLHERMYPGHRVSVISGESVPPRWPY